MLIDKTKSYLKSLPLKTLAFLFVLLIMLVFINLYLNCSSIRISKISCDLNLFQPNRIDIHVKIGKFNKDSIKIFMSGHHQFSDINNNYGRDIYRRLEMVKQKKNICIKGYFNSRIC